MKIVVLTQNVKLKSLEKLKLFLIKETVVVLSTQKLFDFEKEIVKSFFEVKDFFTFADMLTDCEMEWCDLQAFQNIVNLNKDGYDVGAYYDAIKEIKNKLVLKHIIERYGNIEGYICSDDLGVEKEVWLNYGLRECNLEYYYTDKKPICADSIYGRLLKIVNKIVNKIARAIKKQKHEVYVSHWNGMKYVFIGSLNRIGYRMQMDWEESEEEYIKLKKKQYEPEGKCQYLSTLHECCKCNIPDDNRYDVRFIQDGYLPPNYSSLYLKFVPGNVKYYSWDCMGLKFFKNQNIPASIMPFRKKLYLPKPIFAKKIKKILVVTSGAGDWTAVKNRSDEDLMVEAFGVIAKEFPDIEFVYRCHPVWKHPAHQGVNSISRVIEYFAYTEIKNIKTSSNIIDEDLHEFKLSLPRQSLEADLNGTDLVIGEHSIAMIDGAFEGIPFASLNLTGRRNLFCGVSDLGFPHFETIKEIVNFIKMLPKDRTVQKKYEQAVENYNMMTDEV